MYLKRLYIRNFRSIEELDLTFSDGKNVIVGRNNSGKSNIVDALDAVLNESSPTYHKTQNITEKDFRSWQEQTEDGEVTNTADEIFIWCELARHRDEELNYEAMYDDYSLKVLAEGPYQQRRPAQLDHVSLPEDYPPIFDNFNEEASDTKWISTKRPEEQQLEAEFSDKDFFAYAFRATLDGTQIEKGIRFLYRRHETSNWYMGFNARFRNQLLQSAIVPAFRDPGGQLRATHYSWYGKLMKHLTEKHADRERLDEAFAEVKNVADDVFEEMREEVAHSVLDVAFPDSELHFQFNSDAGPDLYKNTEIYVDDGVKSKLTEKGSGIQSATIIGLFNYYTDNVNTISSALLCIEEPELYLHPHARRVISKRLDDFLESGDSPNQVILTTHSVDFIRTARRDLRVILVRKRDDAGTKAQTVPISNFKKLIVDNNQNELFFADKVILCEGYDKYVIEAVADDLFEGALDKENVSVVNVGGKDRLCELARLVTDLAIDCYVMADFDFLLRDKSNEREEYGAKAHDSVLNLDDSFFCQDCLYGDNGTTMKGKLAKFRTGLKNADPKSFYTASQVSDVEDEEYLELLRQQLPSLRKGGLGILSGEIEDFFSDKTLLNGGKLDLEAVYSMNDRRAEGATVGDFLDHEEIRDFLNAVLDQDPKEGDDADPTSAIAE
jgi:predicted ATP-dependent endonuclease of OLD family